MLWMTVRIVRNGVSEGRCCHQHGGRATRNSCTSLSIAEQSSSADRSFIIFTLRHTHFINKSVNLGRVLFRQVSRNKIIRALQETIKLARS